MRLVTKEGIERLLAANPIAEVAAEHGIELVPLGSSMLVGRCPLHEVEAAAGRSLLVSPASGLYRCLTCSARGDVLGLLVRLEGVSVLQALERLAARAGLDLDALMQAPRRPRAQRRSEVPEWALTPPRWLAPGRERGGR